MRDRYRWTRDMGGLAADRRSFAVLARLRIAGVGPRSLRLAVLRGQEVWVRPGTADLWALETFLPPVHLPPEEIRRESVRVIWDLGANIGLTMCHLALVCPGATILGVELDAENAAICRANIAPWGDRCELIEAAAADFDGSIDYERERGDELGFRVVANDSGAAHRAAAISLNTLLERRPAGQAIDYVKMDVEGAEQGLLGSNTEWAERVRSIKVEVHPPYSVADCLADLERLGFEAVIDPVWDSSQGMPPVVGLRR